MFKNLISGFQHLPEIFTIFKSVLGPFIADVEFDDVGSDIGSGVETEILVLTVVGRQRVWSSSIAAKRQHLY